MTDPNPLEAVSVFEDLEGMYLYSGLVEDIRDSSEKYLALKVAYGPIAQAMRSRYNELVDLMAATVREDHREKFTAWATKASDSASFEELYFLASQTAKAAQTLYMTFEFVAGDTSKKLQILSSGVPLQRTAEQAAVAADAKGKFPTGFQPSPAPADDRPGQYL